MARMTGRPVGMAENSEADYIGRLLCSNPFAIFFLVLNYDYCIIQKIVSKTEEEKFGQFRLNV